MDETGISTTSNKPPKVISVKGKKQVGMIANAERGQLPTIIGCCNAAEGRCKQDFLMEARQTQGISTPNGWTSGEVFLNWMHFFVEQVRLTSDKKVLLLLDNYESHKYCPALEYATKNNVVILSLAPHLTHEMQPMDVAVYGPLKTHFEREVNIFQKSHPGRIINQYDVARLLAPAFIKTAVAIIAVHVFERPGIWPINNHAFGDEHFAPAEVLSGRSQSQHDVNMYAADRPCTPMGSDTKKETHDNYAPNASPGPGCSKTYYSFSVLRPMPQPARPTTCKRKLQRYNILTSSTVKEEQKQKFEKGKKPVLKSLDDVSTNASQKTVKKKSIKSKTSAEKPKKTTKGNKKHKKIMKFVDVSCFFVWRRKQ
ncbi:unnamed protein product [Acanthoscelides obtectus]|uniref:DDE-1 domain-containing protein n=1 Tax=Acanthoscelides obtectus TaxID=200917 RepID=A0A9P0QA48_ACAOB|nr:unnamed protein product [Acanthoscelides obtectus]CAK1685282.1 hypothetical protein AOBTE_LOCUS35302 [Acanthoscelides obtectus]